MYGSVHTEYKIKIIRKLNSRKNRDAKKEKEERGTMEQGAGEAESVTSTTSLAP